MFGQRTPLFSKHQARYVADPVLWVFFLLASRLVHKVKSRLLAILFNAPNLYLGPKCVVHGSRNIVFGANNYANGNLWLEAVTHYRNQHFNPSIKIGDGVSFADNVHIACIQSITFEKDVLVGSKVYISDHNHGSYSGTNQSNPDEPPSLRLLGGGGPVVIGKNVWIGENAVILGPVVIGYGAIVASNSVVKQDVAPNTIVAGIPARPIKLYDQAKGSWMRI